MATKQDVAQAIVAQDAAAAPEGDAAPTPYDQPEQLSQDESGLPEGWTLVQAGPDYFSAERYVESLGLQKVSEGATTIEDLQALCTAYDEGQDALAEGWPNQAVLVETGSPNP
jgi:hypothetical protein